MTEEETPIRPETYERLHTHICAAAGTQAPHIRDKMLRELSGGSAATRKLFENQTFFLSSLITEAGLVVVVVVLLADGPFPLVFVPADELDLLPSERALLVRYAEATGMVKVEVPDTFEGGET